MKKGAPPATEVGPSGPVGAGRLSARLFVDALRQVSAAPVAYAELPLAQHAFDVLASFRCQGTTAGAVAFLDAVRAAAAQPTVAIRVRPRRLLDTGGIVRVVIVSRNASRYSAIASSTSPFFPSASPRRPCASGYYVCWTRMRASWRGGELRWK